MDVSVTRTGESAVVIVSGDIDSETAPLLEQRLAQLMRDGVSSLLVDLDAVSFVSSAGLSVFIAAHRNAKQLELRRGNRIVDRLIELTGLEQLYGARS